MGLLCCCFMSFLVYHQQLSKLWDAYSGIGRKVNSFLIPYKVVCEFVLGFCGFTNCICGFCLNLKLTHFPFLHTNFYCWSVVHTVASLKVNGWKFFLINQWEWKFPLWLKLLNCHLSFALISNVISRIFKLFTCKSTVKLEQNF